MKRVASVLLVVSVLGCTEQSSQRGESVLDSKQPWANTAPRSYRAPNSSLVTEAFGEEFQKIGSAEEGRKSLEFARQVVSQWGANPDEIRIDGRTYRYRAIASASEHFVQVIFQPEFTPSSDRGENSLPEFVASGHDLKILFSRHDGKVISIALGA